jgi:serine protease Do
VNGAEVWSAAGSSLELELAEVAERLRRITVQVRSGGRSAGSGVVWRRDGLIVTNAHVATASRAEVVLPDGRVLDGVVTARDRRHDLAALQLAGDRLEPAVRVDARTLRAGELVIALGHPLGVANAAALGVVHRAPGGSRGASRWVQADIRLAPGNSGGPLGDRAGRVVGLNAMIVGGLGYAVPTHLIERFVAGEAARPRLGVTLRPVRVRARGQGTHRLAWLVMDVDRQGGAARAGIGIGDTLLAVDGVALDQPDELADLLDAASAGDRWRIELLRGGRTETHEVVLGGGREVRAA